MLKFGNKEFNNLQEQVLKNTNDLQKFIELTGGFIGVKGDKGDTGERGPQGLTGIRGSQWTIGTNLPASANNGDIHLDYEGNVYTYNGQWVLNVNIRGPQGLIGRPGPQGLQGPQGPRGLQGPQGPQGPQSERFLINGPVADVTDLPAISTVEGRNVAFLVGASAPYALYVISENAVTHNLEWTNAGSFATLDNIQTIVLNVPEGTTEGTLTADQLNKLRNNDVVLQLGYDIYHKTEDQTGDGYWVYTSFNNNYISTITVMTAGSWTKNVYPLEGQWTAATVSYNNSNSGLDATNVQGAILELEKPVNKYLQDNLIVPLEMGNISVGATPEENTYSDSNTRVRTPDGVKISLKAGDIISIGNNENYKVLIGATPLQKPDTQFTVNWFSHDYIIPNDAEVVLLIRKNPESTITLEEVKNILSIKKNKSIIDNIIQEVENNELMQELNDKINAGSRYASGQLIFGFGWNAPIEFNRFAIIELLQLDYDLKIEWDKEFVNIGFISYYNGVGYDLGWETQKDNIFVKKGTTFNINIMPTDNSNTNLFEIREHIRFYKVACRQTKNEFSNNTLNCVNHRGYNTEAPENTIPAFELSKQKGFRIIECDIRLTSDSKFVICHDATIDRTSNGTGNVADMTLQQLLQYDFGSWFGPEFAGTKIPTFEEVLRWCKLNNMKAYCEIYFDADVENIKDLCDLVSDYGMEEFITFISFNQNSLKLVSNYKPNIRLAQNLNDAGGIKLANFNLFWTPYNNAFWNCNQNVIDSVVELAKTNLIKVETWSINDVNTIKNINGYITGITSDIYVATNLDD